MLKNGLTAKIKHVLRSWDHVVLKYIIIKKLEKKLVLGDFVHLAHCDGENREQFKIL